MSEKRWRLVCYDVRDPARYRKLFKIVKGAGESVQYSIFRCRLDDLETERLRWRLSKVLHSEDSLLIVDLCPSCAGRVITRNHVEGWADPPPAFRILGGTCEHPSTIQAPAHGGASAAVFDGDPPTNTAQSVDSQPKKIHESENDP